MNDDDTEERRINIGRRARAVLRAAKAPMTLDEIATALKEPTSDVYDALSNWLHGYVEMRDNKFRLL